MTRQSEQALRAAIRAYLARNRKRLEAEEEARARAVLERCKRWGDKREEERTS